jgi:hypothetical protein
MAGWMCEMYNNLLGHERQQKKGDACKAKLRTKHGAVRPWAINVAGRVDDDEGDKRADAVADSDAAGKDATES